MPVFNAVVSETNDGTVLVNSTSVAINTTDIRLELLGKGRDRIDGKFPPTQVKRMYKCVAVRIHASYCESHPSNKPWVIIYSSINFSRNRLSFITVNPEDGELRSYTAVVDC